MTASQRQRQRQKLLREHARTFSLTLSLLPSWLRDPLGLAYLLARVSDTVADTPGIPDARRLVLLEGLSEALDDRDPSLWKPTFLPDELSASEGELMAALPSLLEELAGHPDRSELLALWRSILEGQLDDQQRFPSQEPLNREELERYCGLVAGSVGETWTLLIAKHAPRLLKGEIGKMCRLGADYGRGLQLVNILRDRAADRGVGRIYARDAELPVLLDQAAELLAQGERYLSLLRPGRALMATALPHDLAVRTLAEIRRSPEKPCVTVSRGAVRLVLLRNLTSLCFPRGFNPAS
jgi:farnesyl-diphosphate farnesyltransferase